MNKIEFKLRWINNKEREGLGLNLRCSFFLGLELL
jgi:hypothetical protein